MSVIRVPKRVYQTVIVNPAQGRVYAESEADDVGLSKGGRLGLTTGALMLFGGGLTLGRLSRVDRQVSQYRRAWEDHNLSTMRMLRAGDLGDIFLMYALGDSATQGVGADTVTQGYVPRLAAAVAAQIDRPVALLNLSVSGATLETVLTHQVAVFQRLASTWRPDLVVANIGGNDVGVPGITPDLFGAYARRVAEALPPGSLMGNIPWFSFLPAEQRAAELSARLDQEMTAAGQVPVDLRGLTRSYGGLDYAVRYHAADLFHPNSRAYEQWTRRYLDTWNGRESVPMTSPAAPEWAMRSLRGEFAETGEAL